MNLLPHCFFSISSCLLSALRFIHVSTQILLINKSCFCLKLLKEFPRDLVSLKRAQILCFYMARPDLSLSLVNQVPFQLHNISVSFLLLFMQTNINFPIKRYGFINKMYEYLILLSFTGSTAKRRRKLHIWHACFSVVGAWTDERSRGSCQKRI